MNPFAMFIVVIVNVSIISVTMCILKLVIKLSKNIWILLQSLTYN
jgi:hypothetical protein